MSTSLPVVYDPPTWARRLVTTQPPQWFSDSAKVPGGNLYSVLYSFGELLTTLQQGLLFSYDSVYIGTAVGSYLDLVSLDYYGAAVGENSGVEGLLRGPGESDASFSKRISSGLLTPVATVGALTSALLSLTGVTPTIIEPWDIVDTGRYDASFFDVPDGDSGGLRFTSNTPYECFVITPPATGGVNIGGPLNTFDDGAFFDSYTMMFADISLNNIQGVLFDTILDIAPVGVVIWVQMGYQKL